MYINFLFLCDVFYCTTLSVQIIIPREMSTDRLVSFFLPNEGCAVRAKISTAACVRGTCMTRRTTAGTKVQSRQEKGIPVGVARLQLSGDPSLRSSSLFPRRPFPSPVPQPHTQHLEQWRASAAVRQTTNATKRTRKKEQKKTLKRSPSFSCLFVSVWTALLSNGHPLRSAQYVLPLHMRSHSDKWSARPLRSLWQR